MKVRITSDKKNPLLKRREVCFRIEHEQLGRTPPRLDVRKAIAAELKTSEDLVFVKRVQTKTGTRTAVGMANVYESIERAELIEPEYIMKRNIPPMEKGEERKE